MPKISQNKVRRFLQKGLTAPTTTEQGRALEDLVCYVFGKIPGIDVIKRNELNAFATEEVDVAFWNNRTQAGLHFLPNVLLVECKNWNNSVGSQEVAYFAQRLQHRSADHGILVAAKGVTGEAADLTAAKYEIAAALAAGQRILVITASELEALPDTASLVRLLKEKLCELAVSGTVFV